MTSTGFINPISISANPENFAVFAFINNKNQSGFDYCHLQQIFVMADAYRGYKEFNNDIDDARRQIAHQFHSIFLSDHDHFRQHS